MHNTQRLNAQHTTFKCTTHNTHNRQTPMPLGGFETAIPASERPQTDALDLVATGIGTENTEQQMFRHRPRNSSTWVKSAKTTVSGKSGNMLQVDRAVTGKSLLN